MKIFTVSEVPDNLTNDWLQHLRDFDHAHPGCHFEVMADAPDVPLNRIVEVMRVNPRLSFEAFFKRGRG